MAKRDLGFLKKELSGSGTMVVDSAEERFVGTNVGVPDRQAFVRRSSQSADGLMYLDVSQIGKLPQVRLSISQDAIDSRAASILANGQLSPITVYSNKLNGLYIIEDGETRFEAIKKLVSEGHDLKVAAKVGTVWVNGKQAPKTIDSELADWYPEDEGSIPTGIVDRFISQAVHNDHHNPLTLSDRLRLVSLIIKSGISPAEACRRLEWSKSTFARLQSYLESAAWLQDFMESNGIEDTSVIHGLAVIFKSENERAKSLLFDSFNYKLTRNDFQVFKKAVEAFDAPKGGVSHASGVIKKSLPTPNTGRADNSESSATRPAGVHVAQMVDSSLDLTELKPFFKSCLKDRIKITPYIPVFFIVHDDVDNIVWEIDPISSRERGLLVGATTLLDETNEITTESFDFSSCMIVAIGESNED